MITGYATIESAVEVMKFGAMDYVQKPFTAEELTEFVDKSLIRRQDRIERQILPSVHLVTPSIGVSTSRHEFNVPSGVFVSPSHTWVNIYPNGMLLVGLDDFLQKLIGPIDRVVLPAIGDKVRKGDPLFTIRQGDHELTFVSPASGEVTTINNDVASVPDLINRKPFEAGWVCGIDPSDLTEDVKSLRLGADAKDWYEDEIKRFTEKVRELTASDETQSTDEPMANGELEARKETVKWDVFSNMGYARVAD
jgi:glycine cleavage system H lipoate-binding protein